MSIKKPKFGNMKIHRRHDPSSIPSATGYRVGGRVWLEKDGETFLAWGRVVLLERIREHGSISAAARSMEMGYRHAWELVDAMNRLAPEPLVEMKTGGQRGGGAKLTPAGEAAIEEFWKLVDEFSSWLKPRQPPARKKRK